MISRISKVEELRILAAAMLDTIPDPFLILDDQCVVLLAGNSFYRHFHVDAAETIGRPLFQLGNRQWDEPLLRAVIGRVMSGQSTMEGFEVEVVLPKLGPKIMLLTVRRIVHEDDGAPIFLLLFDDITERRTIEVEKAALLSETQELLRQKNVLLQELQHRVANSLQIIASILLLKARAVSSEETRHHLEDARQGVMTVAAVQKHLSATATVDSIDVRSYLTKLCESLAASMVSDQQQIDVQVRADAGSVGSAEAVNLGLIVTELLINAIKYAYPAAREDAQILVTYELEGANWQLSVEDNGVGKSGSTSEAGLGTTIVKALAEQLGASVETESSKEGLRVSVTKTTFSSRHPARGVT